MMPVPSDPPATLRSILIAAPALLGAAGCIGTPDAPAQVVEQRPVEEELAAAGPGGQDEEGAAPAGAQGSGEAGAADQGTGEETGDDQGDAGSSLIDLMADAGVIEPPPESETETQGPETNPYLEFGLSVAPFDDDGDGRFDRVMKPFHVPAGVGRRILDLYRAYGRAPVFRELMNGALADGGPPPNQPQPPGSIVFDLHENKLVENWSDPRKVGMVGGAPAVLGDVLYVTAAPEGLRGVERFVEVFFSSVRQIEIESKIVEVATMDELDLGIRPINRDTPIFGLPGDTFVSGVDFSFGNTVSGGEALFTLGSVHDGLDFNAVLEAVAQVENVSIISRPKVAVREGGRAEIVNTRSIPYYQIDGLRDIGTSFNAKLVEKVVGVQMYAVPRVIGRNTIALSIDLEASQQAGTLASFVSRNGDVISNPIITSRLARTTVYLEPGQAVILGGLISERTVEQERKIPILGDFPLIGALFRRKLNRQERTHVLFFVRPRILQGTDLRREID